MLFYSFIHGAIIAEHAKRETKTGTIVQKAKGKMATKTASKRGVRGRVTFVRRNHIVVEPPQELKSPSDPIIDSIGALAEFPLWDEFLAAIEENRQDQNRRVGEES